MEVSYVPAPPTWLTRPHRGTPAVTTVSMYVHMWLCCRDHFYAHTVLAVLCDSETSQATADDTACGVLLTLGAGVSTQRS